MKREDFLGVRIPEGQTFMCTGCGRCCTSGWKVKISHEMAERLQATEVVKKMTKEGYHPLPLIQDEYEIARHDNGVCFFHKDGGCEIHREIGGDHKPMSCQIYPFNFVETPDGVFVSLSYSCPPVLAGMGKPLSHLRAELTDLVARASKELPEPSLSEKRFKVSGENEVSWQEYLELEELLLSKLQAQDPVLFLLNAAAAIISQLFTTGELLPQELNLSNPTPLLQEAYNLMPLFSGACIAIIENENEKDADIREAFRAALLAGDPLRSRLLDTPLPQFKILEPDSLIVQEIIDRYLRNLFFGKRLLLGESVVSRLLLLACSISVLLYYHAVKAGAGESRHFSFDDLDWAFELVEANIVTHTHDLEPYFEEFEKVLWSSCAVCYKSSVEE